MEVMKQAAMEAMTGYMRELWRRAGGTKEWGVLYADNCEVADQLRAQNPNIHRRESPVVAPGRVEHLIAMLDALKIESAEVLKEARREPPDGWFRVVVIIGREVGATLLPTAPPDAN